MNPEQNNEESLEVAKEVHPVFQVTTFSKYLALIVFSSLPFLGGWIGYMYAPEKVVEIEKNVTKEIEVEKENMDENTHIVVSQLMWFWTVTVDDMNNLMIGSNHESFVAPTIKATAPEGWVISQNQSSEPYVKTIRFVDPNLPGRPDTDVPIAHVGLSFAKDTETCTGTTAYKNGISKKSATLSNDQFDIYDTGWVDGWAGLPSRVLCIDSQSEYGEVIEMSLYPITEENKVTLEEMLNQMTL